MKFEPLKDRLVIKTEYGSDLESSTLILHETLHKRLNQGEVLAIGSEVHDVKVGDRVMFGKSEIGLAQTIEGIECLIMKENQIWAILEERNG